VTTDVAPAKSPPIEDPYVGLTYFTEEYVDFFFGRENESALIIGNLRASRLTLLYAESGVGKSSVLRAGVVARLHDFAERDRQGSGYPRLVPVVFSSWSERPIAGLVHELGGEVRHYLEEAEVPELPEDDLEAALEAASQALGATLFVILDQFEEHFLYPEEAPEEDRVAAQIARCVNRPDLRANFLVSIREDSYAELGDLFRGKVKNVYSNFLHLDFLDRAGGREAIEKPVERLNELRPGAEPFSVEPALVDAVLDQVRREEGDERVETTYLQLVMRRLWQEEVAAGSHVLRLATLERLGGAQAVIGSHLDRAMEGGEDGGAGLTPEQRLVAARIFRFLVTSGGTKIALTAGDLAELSGLSGAEIEPVLRHLSSPRLHILRPVVLQEEDGEPRFEIFHDALAEPIRKWRSRVEKEEGDARRERERAEKEEAQRAAAEAKRQAERERQRKRVAQALLALAVVALLAGAAIFAISQKNLADQREADSQSVRAAERISELAQVPSFGPLAAALASVEAYRLAPTPEARERALAELQLNPALPQIISGHTRAVESVAFWPGSGKLASGGDETVRLWGADGHRLAPPLLAGAQVLEVAVSEPRADGTRILAAGLKAKGVRLWEVSPGGTARAIGSVPGGRGGTKGVAFDPLAPDVLAVGSHDGSLALWGLKDPRHPQPLGSKEASGEVEDVTFAADGGSLLVAASEGGEVFKLAGRGFAGSAPEVKTAEASAVATARDGSYAFGGKGGIELWNRGQGPTHLSLPGKVYGLAFAQRGKILVSGGSDWNVTTWDVTSGRPFGPPRAGNRAPVDDVAVSPDGRTIASAGAEWLVKLWPLAPSRTMAMTVGGLAPREAGSGVPKIFDLSAGPGGQVAAPVGAAGTTIWSLRRLGGGYPAPHPVARIPGRSLAAAYHGDILVTGRGNSFVVYGTGAACEGKATDPCPLAAPTRPHSEGAVTSFAFVPREGHLLLASTGRRGKGGALNLWDLTGVKGGGGVVPLSSTPTRSHLFQVAYDPEHELLAAAPRNGELKVWDIAHPRSPASVEVDRNGTEKQAILTVAFSPDGSQLATGGRDHQVVLWRVHSDDSGPVSVKATPGTLLQLQVITSIAFSPNGKTLAAADGGGNICLYEVDNRHLIGDRSCLRGYNISTLPQSGGIEATTFARLPDGETALMTAGKAEPIVAWNSLLWNLDDSQQASQSIRDDVCALARRNLREHEWSAVFASTKLAGDRRQTCPQYPLPE
jgi:WD40 repeat protein